jgi:hypothetical protein
MLPRRLPRMHHPAPGNRERLTGFNTDSAPTGSTPGQPEPTATNATLRIPDVCSSRTLLRGLDIAVSD